MDLNKERRYTDVQWAMAVAKEWLCDTPGVNLEAVKELRAFWARPSRWHIGRRLLVRSGFVIK